MSETLIHPEKVRAYLATDYRLGHTDQDIILSVGKHSVRVAELFVASGVDCGAFLTAYNPRGARKADHENDLAHSQLAAKLADLSLQTIEGSGSEEGTDWPSERSYFALGLALEDARTLGLHFDQDAIVWVGSDAVPKLILLR